MTASNSSQSTPIRAAIIGSGPAGLYTATELLKAYPNLLIDIFEQNWAPYGLIRYGVAPDHQKTKRVTKLLSKTLHNPRVRFFGGVNIGTDLSLEELDAYYSLVVLATGAEKARRLDLPETDKYPTGLDIVTWYNGHPAVTEDYAFNFKELAIVGNGNVALDIARLLCQPEATLRATDLPEHVLERLLASEVRDIHIVGRRGPAQIAFRPPELKEIACLPHVQLLANDLHVDEIDQQNLDSHNQVLQKKGLAILNEAVADINPGASHRIHFHFRRQPLAFQPGALQVGLTHIEGDITDRHPALQSEQELIPCGQVVQSIGYYGTAPEGFARDPESGTVLTENHRISLSPNSSSVWLASGWIKKGPRGLIGHNHMDAVEVIRSLEKTTWQTPRSKIDPTNLLRDRKVSWVDAKAWAELDQREIENGQASGKIREKFILPRLS